MKNPLVLLFRKIRLAPPKPAPVVRMPAQPDRSASFDLQMARLQALMILSHHLLHPRPRYRVSFTKDDAARQQAILLAIDTMSRLHQLAPDIYNDSTKREAIMRKLFGHLNRAGIQTADAIHDFTPHALSAITYIARNPDLADAPVNFAGILKRSTHETEPELRLPPDTPPRPVIWRHPDGVHTITEITHPCHLMEEGHFLRHCISRHYNELLLKDTGLDRGTPAGATCLTYWLAIENNQTRLFSLCANGTPRVSINYQIKSRSLAEFGARTSLHGDEPFFPALIDAIVYLAAAMKPLYLNRCAFDIEPLVDALTQRVSSNAHQIFLYPDHHLDLI